MPEEKNKMEEILREFLKADKNLLSNRSEFIEKLEAKIPDDLRRDFNSIKRAVQIQNVGETFLAADSGSDEEKNAAIQKVSKILTEAGLQEKRAQFVVETFSGALDWFSEVEEENFGEENFSTEEIEEPKNLPITPTVDSNSNEWQCSCGTFNAGNFCKNCGKPKENFNQQQNFSQPQQNFNQPLNQNIKSNNNTTAIILIAVIAVLAVAAGTFFIINSFNLLN